MTVLSGWTQGRKDATTESSPLCVFVSLRRSAASLRLAVLAAFLVACSSPGAESPAKTLFASPLIGRPMEELFYGAYLDQGSRDYNCGAKYYSGHRGTDILLRNFRVQDSGVTVVAAAAGRVMLTHDGEPDRNSVQNGQNP